MPNKNKKMYGGIYLCLGYPDLNQSLECLGILSDHQNVEFIELGLPFSDPIADGKVISEAAQVALREAKKTGISPQDMLKKAMETLKNSPKDVYLMTYANMIYKLQQQYQGFNELPLDGLIIPDAPLREQKFFAKLGLQHQIIPFATPESTPEDLELLAKEERAKFIYFVAVRGITGSQTDFQSSELQSQYATVQHATAKNGCPVVLGFGVRSKTEIEQLAEFAEGYVIGTAAVQLQNQSPKAYQSFINSL